MYVATGWKSFRDLDPFIFGTGVIVDCFSPKLGKYSC